MTLLSEDSAQEINLTDVIWLKQQRCWRSACFSLLFFFFKQKTFFFFFSEKGSNTTQSKHPNLYKTTAATFKCPARDLHLYTHTLPTKSIITTHGHCLFPQECVYAGVCYYDVQGCVVYIKKQKNTQKKQQFHLFVTVAAFSWCLTTTLHSGLSFTPPQKAMKWNGGDRHILAGAGQTLLVNTRRLEQG